MNAIPSSFGIVPLGRIISASEAGLYNDANAALLAAQQTAASIIAEAEAKAEDIRAAALQAGRDDANAEAATLLAHTASGIQATLDGLAAEIAGTIADAVSRIIGTLGLDDAMASIARLAMRDLRSRHGVIIRISPTMSEAVTASCADLPGLRIEPDAALDAGDCVIVTEAGTIQAGLNRQLDALRAALLAAASAGP